MLSKDEVYALWAPQESVWSPWVKPVLFSFVGSVLQARPPRSFAFKSDWVPGHDGSTAIILDVPGETGVFWSLELARLGYRPVPLYNALPFPVSEKPFAHELRPPTAVDAESILSAIIAVAPELQKISLPPNAPPVFLLDADRRIARTDLDPGVFDNRSVCFTTDFPSDDFLLQHGIDSVLVIRDNTKFAQDLIQTLVTWQQRGIRVLSKSRLGNDLPVQVVVKPPGILSGIWFRITVALGLRRSELGGFGGIVPASSG